MMTLHDRYPDALDDESSPRRIHLLTDLDCIYGCGEPSPRAEARLMEEVRRHATRPAQTTVRRPLARLASLGAALLLTIGGGLAYEHVANNATPVSAQAILRRAIAAQPRLPPDQVLHFAVRSHEASTDRSGGGVTPHVSDYIVDTWVQQGSDGALAALDTTQTSITGTLLSRTVLTGTNETRYDAQQNVVDVTTGVPPSAPARRADMNIPDWSGLVGHAQQGTGSNLRLLPTRNLDGAAVDVVQWSHTVSAQVQATITFYIDAHTYALRQSESEVVGGGLWTTTTVQVLHDEAVPLANVPAHVFKFQPPAGATVHTAPYGS